MPKRYTKADRSITAAVGTPFDVDLPSVPTAGYEWSLAIDDDCVRLVKKVVVPASREVGGGAVERFTLMPRAAGSCALTFEYRRAWERSAHETVRMLVRIR